MKVGNAQRSLSQETSLTVDGLILVVPCTSSQVQERSAYSNHVLIPSGTGELTRDTIAQTHLIQPIEVSYLERKMGNLRI